MTRGRWAAIGLVVATGLGATFLGSSILRDEVHLRPGDRIQSALDRSAPGTRIVLAPGSYKGPLAIDRAVEIVGEAGATIVVDDATAAAVSVTGPDVLLEGFSTSGGSTGILVRETEGIQLEDVSVRGARLHGIEIVDASAIITRARVTALRDPLAQGIEIRNADGRPDSVIEESTVVGGQDGIVSHVSEVVVRDNVVANTTLRGITITEMSDGVVHGNTIRDAAGAGLYCGDMSRCEFRDNHVERVAATPLARPTEGWGLVVTYHAAASSERDHLEGAAGRIFTSIDGHLSESTPFELSTGSDAVRPVGIATALAFLVGAIVFAASARAAALVARIATARSSAARWILPVAVAGLFVQTFHMIEHGLQVFRVHVDGLPSRGGLVGPVVEAESVHFIYNALVLGALFAIVVARSRGWRPPGDGAVGDRLLVTAVALQGYHFIEHCVKLVQHITTGAKVNPGIAGQHLDLVLFHYGINLAVYLACLGAVAAYVVRQRAGGSVRRVPRFAMLRS